MAVVFLQFLQEFLSPFLTCDSLPAFGANHIPKEELVDLIKCKLVRAGRCYLPGYLCGGLIVFSAVFPRILSPPFVLRQPPGVSN